ncbi:unnamed protein product, partial [Polarella glacialis]
MSCASRSRSPKKTQGARHHTVGDIVAVHDTAICAKGQTLGEACDILLSSRRSAAVVVDDHGTAAGVLTENDVLAALVNEVPLHYSIWELLRDEKARLPGSMLARFTVAADATIVEAAGILVHQWPWLTSRNYS